MLKKLRAMWRRGILEETRDDLYAKYKFSIQFIPKKGYGPFYAEEYAAFLKAFEQEMKDMKVLAKDWTSKGHLVKMPIHDAETGEVIGSEIVIVEHEDGLEWFLIYITAAYIGEKILDRLIEDVITRVWSFMKHQWSKFFSSDPSGYLRIQTANKGQKSLPIEDFQPGMLVCLWKNFDSIENLADDNCNKKCFDDKLR